MFIFNEIFLNILLFFITVIIFILLYYYLFKYIYYTGRMAECMNAAAKENLPLLFIVIDNGRAINTFTPDVAANSDVFASGMLN